MYYRVRDVYVYSGFFLKFDTFSRLFLKYDFIFMHTFKF